MKYKDLLVGVDFSPCSADALKEAVRLAAYDNARVTVIHVLDDEVIEYLKDHTVLDETRTRYEAQVRLDHFAGIHAGGYDKVETILLKGAPFVELIKAAAENDSDMLMLGSRGHGADETRIGAVASRCLRKAPLPVFLSQDRSGQPFQQVVCCVDYSQTSKRAVTEAIRLAKLDQAALDFVHVFASPHAYQEPAMGYVIADFGSPQDFAKLMRQNLDTFLAPFEDEMEGINVSRSVIDRLSVGRGIINHLGEMRADLVVLGTRGRTGWKKLLLGTTAEHVIHSVPCSALAVKPEDFHYELD